MADKRINETEKAGFGITIEEFKITQVTGETVAPQEYVTEIKIF